MRSTFVVLALAGLAAIATPLALPGAERHAPAQALYAGVADTASMPEPPQEAVESAPLPDGPDISVTVTRQSRFAWPAAGPLTSYFGPGHPTGIDIGLAYGQDAPILASAAGTVSFAGGNACCSYGYYVVIDHDGGPSPELVEGSGHSFSTLYGHFAEVLVEEGQEVQQGDLLGFGGSTGDADGKHLHFEVQEDGSLVDPLRFLPLAQESLYAQKRQSINCPSEPIALDAASTAYLEFVVAAPDEYVLEDVHVGASDSGASFPVLVVQTDSGLGITIRVPPSPVASGRTAYFQLDATLRHGDETQEVACRLDVKTMKTLSNSDATIARYRAKFAPSPTQQPAATATLWRPAPAATQPPFATRTPRGAGPTPTPRQPQPLQVPTRTARR